MKEAMETDRNAEASFESELVDIGEALARALETEDLGSFYSAFRASSLPYVAVDQRHDPALAFRRVARTVRHLGAFSSAVGLAVENHYYVLSAIATLPAPKGSRLATRRDELIGSIRERRWLVANSNSRVHGDRIAKTGTVARRVGENYRIEGEAVYMSLASEGDLVVFVTLLEDEGPAIFFAPLAGNPRLEVGPLLFPDVMRDSDTRRVRFEGLELPPGNLLLAGRDNGLDILSVIRFELTWHQALLAALAIGTAARGIEEARLFLRQVERADGEPLAELDGMIVDVGRLALAHHVAHGAVERAGRHLAEICAAPLEPRSLSHAFELACAAKHGCTAMAENVVGKARRIVGARSLTPGHPLERLSKEALFAPLGGEVNAAIERQVGQRVLGERSFLDVAAGRRKAPQTARATKALAGVRALARKRKET